MAVQSNLKNMVLCLFTTCLVCSAVLAGVYALTAAPIAQTNAQLLQQSVGAVLPEGGELSEAKDLEVGGQPSEYYILSENGQDKAYAVKSTVVGFGGPLVLMVGVTADGKVYNTSVLSHTETPGLGAKCTTDEGFMAQWKELDPAVKILKVKKDGGDIDAITASTITSRAYTLAVQNAIDAVKGMGDASTGASVKPKEEMENEQ
ncbi:MAG: RnfABCDGE type electron transport complex subunit G [Bacteroidales bacterium]|nr:RnfABCDGE type electron transport complex subunit G [Bacteroidales bacterium]